MRFVPILSAVARFKNAAAGQGISGIFSCEINVVYCVRRPDRTLSPGETVLDLGSGGGIDVFCQPAASVLQEKSMVSI